jgi:hypothetical protein
MDNFMLTSGYRNDARGLARPAPPRAGGHGWVEARNVEQIGTLDIGWRGRTAKRLAV